jgi:hypothetical protein
MFVRLICVALVLALLPGCASLGQMRGLVQPPLFEQADGQPAEVRLIGPRADLPLGGAGIRLWTRITNPNPFGFTLGTLRGSLFLEGSHAAQADFPLGLPLSAGEAAIVPIDVSVSFADLPGLADAIRRAANRQPLAYRFDGTIGVDAGRLGQPTFGPMTLWRGTTAGQ